LFYGHYDVVGAESNRHKWNTDPFKLASINGYLYGRGVSDNKGPLLAALYAAAELTQKKALGCNIVFLIEGEEESGSQGFAQTVQENKALIGNVDWILLANSYWLDDYIPCLTYGLRGVVRANLVVTSHYPDLHSGIDGSSLLDEPLKDLTMVLGTLVGPKGKINLPGFHESVLQVSEVERRRYDAIAEALLPHHPEIENCEYFTKSLMHRWREPSLTIHNVEIPRCRNSSTTISRKAKAALSLRLVPNQEADKVAKDLTDYVQDQFAQLDSQNTLTVEITGKSDPWLGDPDNDIFETLAQAVTAAWSPRKESRYYNYPLSNRARQLYRPELFRADSSDSVASHFDRIISSSSSAPKPSILRRAQVSAIPTSSTLADSSAPIHTSPRTCPAIPLLASESQQHPHAQSHHQQERQGPARGIRPIYIREGGSIPTIRFLEKEFNAPAAHLPCGQASDHAHLDNERLRVENLYKSREIFRWVFRKLGEKDKSEAHRRNDEEEVVEEEEVTGSGSEHSSGLESESW
jgi:di- and tripeptidase